MVALRWKRPVSSPRSVRQPDGIVLVSDRDRLKNALSKLANEPSLAGQARRLTGETTEALVLAMLTEVDETVIGRRLSFSAGNRRFVLDAANRRVLYAVSPVDIDLSDKEDPAQAEALRAGLLSFVEGQTEVSVITSPSAAARETGTLGIAATVLAEAWGLETELSLSDPLSPVLARLLGEVSKEVTAWMRLLDTEEIASDGPKTSVDALRRFVARQAPIGMQQGDLGLAPLEGPECVFLPPAPRRDFPVLMAADGQERLLLCLEDGAEVAAIRAFKTAVNAQDT